MNKIISEDMKRLAATCPYVQNFTNKTIFITGANGLIAKNLTYFFLYLNEKYGTNTKVVALVRNLRKAQEAYKEYINDTNFKILNQDVCQPIKYEGEVDYIFHAASSASATAIKKDPVGIIKANTIGTMNVLEFARTKNVKNIVFPSTREIYGKVTDVNEIKEDDMGVIDPLNSRNCYPESKRLAEALFVSYYNQYNVPFTIVRIAHTYGPTMEIKNDGRVMSDFIGAIVNNENIVLNSDGTAIRSFCYVTDCIEGIIEVMINGEIGNAYNLANETEPNMIRDVAQMLVDAYSEKRLKVEFSNPTDEIKKGYVNYKIVKLDTTKLKNLGWSPKVKLQEGLMKTVSYFEEEKKLAKKNK